MRGFFFGACRPFSSSFLSCFLFLLNGPEISRNILFIFFSINQSPFTAFRAKGPPHEFDLETSVVVVVVVVAVAVVVVVVVAVVVVAAGFRVAPRQWRKRKRPRRPIGNDETNFQRNPR